MVDFSTCTVACAVSAKTAIDEFLDARSDVISRSASADAAQLGMLVLWAMSASEAYFRRVFAELSGICPVAREKVATQVAVVGALDYYGRSGAAMAVLDAGSLSDPDTIRKKSSSLLAIEVSAKRGAAVENALVQYDYICHLRHALVHSSGRLGFGNIQTLGLRSSTPCRVQLDLASFQASVAIVENLVRAYNQHAFATVIERWVHNRLLTGEWAAHDKVWIEKLYAVCRCERDGMPSSPFALYRKEIQSVARKRNAAGP